VGDGEAVLLGVVGLEGHLATRDDEHRSRGRSGARISAAERGMQVTRDAGMYGACEHWARSSDRVNIQGETPMKLTRILFLAMAVMIPTSWTIAKADDAPAAEAPKKEKKAKKAKKTEGDKKEEKKAE
jgi:hypothetical protein